ncbi:PDZ domain-containing protein [Sphingobium sp.]|uniref:PDZ domain-containing protein n=1 Tax=Sphingobium sp. TaxID=1912891 RepID=UPI0039B8C3BC
MGRGLAALALSASPLALSGHVHPLPTQTAAPPEPAGLTVADGRRDSAIVTSLRSDGPAEHGGLAVGDEVQAVDGHRARGAASVRHDLRHAQHCNVAIDLRRSGRPLVATVGRCGRTSR